MKKIIFVSLFLLFGVVTNVLAQEVEISFFYSSTCLHCAKEEKFLDEMEEKYPDLIVNRFSISNSENIRSLKELYAKYEVPKSKYGSVPVTFINDYYFIGFNDSIGEEIEKCIIDIENSQCDPMEGETTFAGLEGEIEVPLLGKIDVQKYSLPALAILLGALDGFNVCSLGALVLILGLVLALKSRKKVLLFGGLFILTTSLVYGTLIVIWYNIFAFFISYLGVMQVLIGLLGIGGGIYFLSEFLKFRKYGPTCEVSPAGGIVSKFSNRFKQSLQESKNIVWLIMSVLLFAAIITIIEFPCSAVVPVAFAGVLAQSGLSTLSYLLYVSLFILFYMLDEIIVFLIAFFTMKVWLSSSKVVTWITLAESIILFILGAYYLFSLL